jgi:23S rRNA pseudoU1915 N3-methylase RlmH
MIPFSLIAVGKLREPLWQEAQATYLERLRPYAKCTVTEVLPEPTSPSVTAHQSRHLEGQRIAKALRCVLDRAVGVAGVYYKL